MIYTLNITVSESDELEPAQHMPVTIRTISDGGVLEQKEAEKIMVAEAFKAQVLDLIQLMSPAKRPAGDSQ